ncbi:MAG TPA: integrase, partial [Amnibacterium sp.]|nr:integrase [Amnibacterium sp.]
MPKRRDHGQGALYEMKGRGLWRGVIDDGFTPDGRRRQRYVYAKSREACVQKLRQLMREVAEGGALDHHTRVADLAKRWLDHAAQRLKPKTLSGYRSHVAANIVPTLGRNIVSELRPSDVRRMHSAIFARNVGPATVAGAHRTLSAMLGYAVDEGIIVRNVAEAVDIPRQAPAERDSLTREEAQALLALGDPRWSLAL